MLMIKSQVDLCEGSDSDVRQLLPYLWLLRVYCCRYLSACFMTNIARMCYSIIRDAIQLLRRWWEIFRLCHFSCCAFFSYLTLMNYLASEDILKENILAKLIDCMNWHWSMNPSIMPSPYTKGAQDDDDDHLAIFLLNIQIFQLNVNFRFAIPHSDNKRHLTAAGLQQQFNDV